MDLSFSIRSLASGSAGNCWLLRAGETRLLIDAGLSSKRVAERLAVAGVNPEDIRGIVVTHEHGDHVHGVPVLSRRFGYATWAVEEAVNKPRGRRNPPLAREAGMKINTIRAGEVFRVGELDLRPFSVSHDSADPVMFVFEYKNRRIGFCTDLGTVTRLVLRRLEGIDALVIESNHDPKMLKDGPYRPEDKKRIRGRFGHLSNEDAQKLVRRIAHPGLSHVILAHLSLTNNTRELATLGMQRVLEEVCPECVLHVAGQHEVGEVVELSSKEFAA